MDGSGMTGEGEGWAGVAIFRPEGAAIYQPRASPWVDVPQSVRRRCTTIESPRRTLLGAHLGGAGELRGLGGTFRAEGDGGERARGSREGWKRKWGKRKWRVMVRAGLVNRWGVCPRWVLRWQGNDGRGGARGEGLASRTVRCAFLDVYRATGNSWGLSAILQPSGVPGSLLRNSLSWRDVWVPGAARFPKCEVICNFKEPCGARHLLLQGAVGEVLFFGRLRLNCRRGWIHGEEVGETEAEGVEATKE